MWGSFVQILYRIIQMVRALLLINVWCKSWGIVIATPSTTRKPCVLYEVIHFLLDGKKRKGWTSAPCKRYLLSYVVRKAGRHMDWRRLRQNTWEDYVAWPVTKFKNIIRFPAGKNNVESPTSSIALPVALTSAATAAVAVSLKRKNKWSRRQ